MIRVRYCTTTPKKKAMATLTKMAIITFKACSVFNKSLNPREESAIILIMANMKVAPNSSKTMETVVEVGIPKRLKISKTMTSVTITAKKIIMTSWKLNWAGFMMPCRATSIMPDDMTAPRTTPKEAMMRMVRNLATLAPTADCKKLTASLETPTNKSKTAKESRKMTMHK